MESDDRVTLVIKHLDDALAELDRMDQMMGMYKHHFGVSFFASFPPSYYVVVELTLLLIR